MGEFSVYQPFTQFDEQLFQLEPLPCSEPSLPEYYEDILANFVTHSEEYIANIDTDGLISARQKVKDEKGRGCQEETQEKKDSALSEKKRERVKRGRGRPAVRKSWTQRRDEANTRERRRMRDLVR